MGPGLFSDRLRIKSSPNFLAFSTNPDSGAAILSVSPCHSPTILSTAATNGAANPSAVDTTDCLMPTITLPTRSGKASRCDRSTWGIRLLMKSITPCHAALRESAIAPTRTGSSRNVSQAAVRGKPATKPTADRQADWIDSPAPATTDRARSTGDRSGENSTPPITEATDRHAPINRSPIPPNHAGKLSNRDQLIAGTNPPRVCTMDRHPATN